MTARLEHPDEYELVNRDSGDEDHEFDLDEADFQSSDHATTSYAALGRPYASIRAILSRLIPLRSRTRPSASHRRIRSSRSPQKTAPRARRRCHRPYRRCCILFNGVFSIILAMAALTALFRPSYNNLPSHYRDLKSRVRDATQGGSANPENQKIFIAASLYDQGGHLLKGAWAESVLDLIEILGNENVFLSIYENGGDKGALDAQIQFEKKLQAPHSIVYDTEFSMDNISKVQMPDFSMRIKRMAYLADVRNKALLPLEKDDSVKYDKLLYLNDVIFDPIDAAQLLLSTNGNAQGHSSYRAACAVDFINPFKFYDTFASRDAEGYSMGVPFFPWFTNAGSGYSRSDVLEGTDAVRVKSCWGGMVAFDARPFQHEKPLRFRATEDLYWDASECCLIHADLMDSDAFEGEEHLGIYMNPFVRVAYGSSTLRWLSLTRRFERLYSTIHNIANHMVGLPWFNPRRNEQSGEKVEEKVWFPDSEKERGGAFHFQSRIATGDGFCGIRMLQLMRESPRKGEKNWEMMPVPPG